MENYIRLGAFWGLFLLIALWEILRPRRALSESKAKRWGLNLGLSGFNILLLRFGLGLTLTQVALFCQQLGWGVFNYLNWPITLELLLGWAALDFGIYLQHMMSHYLPIFWRSHQVHHSDLNLDVSSGVRFHPLEIMVSFGFKTLMVFALGPSVGAVILFEMALNLGSTFNHGNIYIPPKLDRVLRLFIVTPDVHRIHHSARAAETNSNFGFSVPWWDQLCGTFCGTPQRPQTEFDIGLDYCRDFETANSIKGTLITLPLKHASQKN